MLNKIEASISHQLAELEAGVPKGSALHGHAAVLIALTDEPDPHVILTKRSANLSTHSGEVSLPGGRWDVTDPSLQYTALREAEEEIALPMDAVRMLGPLWPRTTRWKVSVTPWVAVIAKDIALTPNPGELDAIFRVPLSFFLADPRIRTDHIIMDDCTIHLPAYRYDGYEIWGFTAGLLTEFMVKILGASQAHNECVETA
ncbi:NUDIX hydrolase [Microbulbifer spongiae]|uniref:CoA pyrophosphatase n=1 Tax=Microbulbifer spongiae TaxID=2944933 RepID=A0ABY9E5Y4_9GAMM|nr:CoA pyrophosphatase [Microbulbifer sp. MI-G]WKD48433.1 CoA pyrophosphatase [Microbulbifer sp. MI-G]